MEWSIVVKEFGNAWEYEAVNGELPDLAGPVLLADGFTYSWEWVDGQYPGHMEPSQLTFTLAAASMSALAHLERDQIIKATMYGAGAAPLVPFTGRITEIAYEVVPQRKRTVIATVTAVDMLGDLSQRFPALPWHRVMPWNQYLTLPFAATPYPNKPRLYHPITWAQGAAPVIELARAFTDDSLLTQARELLDSGGILGHDAAHTLVPWYGNVTPSGIWGGIEDDWPAAPWTDVTYETDLASPFVYMAVPATREALTGYGVGDVMPTPLRLVWDVTQEPEFTWTTVGWDPGAAHELTELTAIPACAIEVPANARQAGDTTSTVLNIAGVSLDPESGDFTDTTVERSSGWASQGRRSRTIQTMATVRGTTASGAASASAVLGLIIDSHQVNLDRVGPTPIAWDAFTIRPDLLDQAAAEAVLIGLLPRHPESSPWGDSAYLYPLVRPVALFDLDPALGLSGDSYQGAPVSGRLTVEAGRVSVEVTLTPGSWDYQTATGWPPDLGLVSPADLTAAGAPWDAYLTPSLLDPRLTAQDFLLIGAPT